MKPKYRLRSDGVIEPIMRPFENDQVQRLVNQFDAASPNVAMQALKIINERKL
jgi:hypothetical protein